ncbi:hypothetical protein S7335_1208 [Synechococcus sp. PCC 7335]|nr:hypothetical protein S7335_1208 [Synechococcus sp. PCC 7335]
MFLTAVGIIGVIWVTPTISKIISEGFEELSSIDGLDYLHINFSIIAALLPIALVLILVINILRNWPGNNW